jgi:hypothetical protein
MELPDKHGMHLVPVYEIDVRAADGTTGRERVPSAEYPALRPGTIVRLEISAKTGEIRLHPHRAQLIIGYSPSQHDRRFHGCRATDDLSDKCRTSRSGLRAVFRRQPPWQYRSARRGRPWRRRRRRNPAHRSVRQILDEI